MRATIIVLLSLLAGACGETPVVDIAPVIERAQLRPGDVHRYDFAWTVKSEGGGLGDVPAQGDIDLRGELSVRVYEKRPEGVLVGVRFSRLDTHHLGVLGQNVLPEPTALLVDEAIVIVPRDA